MKQNYNNIYNKYISTIVISLTSITTLSTIILSGITINNSYASTTATATATIRVADSCTAGTTDHTYNRTLNLGSTETITGTDISITCNDYSGFDLYAVGYSGDSYDDTNTDMISSTNTAYNIKTNGTGNNSYWKMKLEEKNTTGQVTIPSAFTSFTNIPSDYTKVASRNSSTSTGSITITPSYQVHISTTQPAGSYTGKVKYTIVHPSGTAAPEKPRPTLYDTIAAMSKGKQTAAQLQATITVPTSADRTQDTSNSGVYEYDASVFGTSSDASDDYKIYYYRGVLENTVGSYGSDGSAVTYPNYVILDANGTKDTSDTCWRIVRTTGSGGVKMIYNGRWTGSTCANAQTKAQVNTQAFGLKGNSAQSTYLSRNINRVGYTFNNTQSLQDSTASTSVDTVFGSDSSPSTNNERSNIKKYIEDAWYASNMTAWTSKLEASAGYCNDRTAFSDKTGATALTTIPPYATSSADMYFGAYARNYNSAKAPSLSCPRSTVDLYRYVSGSTGVSNELKYPVALITADEASFAGSGSSTASYGSGYNANSYLYSGSIFWLLSPHYRASDGGAGVFTLYSNGNLFSNGVRGTYGVRPAISLISGTTISSGSGTATDPWIVQ